MAELGDRREQPEQAHVPAPRFFLETTERLVAASGSAIPLPHPQFQAFLPAHSVLTADNIESNIVNVHAHTTSAAEELTSAHEYQRKAGRRMACLLIILAIVALFILLAILA